MPVKLPGEPGDITGKPAPTEDGQNAKAIVITVVFLNYFPGMLVALSVNCHSTESTVGGKGKYIDYPIE